MVQKDWYTWGELLEKWGKQDFELLILFKEGLQPYKKKWPSPEQIFCPYDWHEHNFFVRKCGRLTKLSEILTNRIYENEKTQRKRRNPPPCTIDDPCDFVLSFLKENAPDILPTDCERSVSILIPPGEIEILREKCQKELAFSIARAQQIHNDDPRVNKWKYFRLPVPGPESEKIMKDLKLEEAIFKRADVLRMEGKREGAPPSPKVNELDPEDFVRKLRVFYESDFEIKIQLPRKPPLSYNQAALGFHRSNGKVWNDFLMILQKPDDPTYQCGIAHGRAYADKSKLQRKKGYDVGQKRLAAMNKKLIAFFTKEYEIQFPKGYKIYEHLPNDGSGIYRFKFHVGGRKEAHSENFPEEEIERD
jgi:hypothetical protein